jgi:hypothetical protein
VLATGALVALALVPSASLVAAGLVMGEWGLAGRALARWAIDAVLVLVASLAVFGWKRRSGQGRRSML